MGANIPPLGEALVAKVTGEWLLARVTALMSLCIMLVSYGGRMYGSGWRVGF